MCGIIGYIGKREAAPLILRGLHRLEYRGYDSAGIAIVSGEKLFAVKSAGMITALEARPELKRLIGNIGIAHTRWATHGEPTEQNAHPHLDCKGEIAVVHNGIIENYMELREALQKRGHTFNSETDSEVIAHLIEESYEGVLEDAVARALKLLEGTFGLAVVHTGERKVVAVRRSSPLIIGIGQNEMFVASDVAAVVEHTSRVVHLDDDEIACIRQDGFSVMRLSGEMVEKRVDKVEMSLSQIEKKGFKHFMLKEIFEQPASITNLLRGRLKDGKITLTPNLGLARFERVIFVGCGTSWHSAIIGRYLAENLAGIRAEFEYASEFRYRKPIVTNRDLVVVISQSGETADTLGALREAKKRGARTLGIVNVVGSTISREVDGGIYLHAGPEIGVASTKAFTSQVMALLLLTLYIRQERGLENDPELIREAAAMPAKINAMLDNLDVIKNIAREFASYKNFIYLGRGINYPVALEGALKLKEISYIHAEGYPAGEMKHGPIALIDDGFPVVFIVGNDAQHEKVLGNMQEVKARKGRIIAVCSEGDTDAARVADYCITVPQTSPLLSPILNVVPLQLLAYYVADAKGLDVDRPRNLAKSVTVE